MRNVLPVVLIAATLAVANAAWAQPPAPGGQDAPPREAMRQDWAVRRRAHEAREVADISTVLRLRPEQQTGLRAWLEAGRGDRGGRHGRMGERPDAAQASLTTAQTLDRQAARMAERDTRERARLDATRRFYASLSPDQQGAFDALERLRHGRGERRGGFGGRGMGGGMRMGWRGQDGAEPAPRTGD